jgi:hypothetical protein
MLLKLEVIYGMAQEKENVLSYGNKNLIKKI